VHGAKKFGDVFVGSFVEAGQFTKDKELMLTHHRLKVYEKALALGASAEVRSASWGRRHAIVEQFRRASESVVLIAAASTVKAAAYLEIYQHKALPDRVETAQGLELLSRVLAMLSRF
jgi:hypothetical protein